MTYTIIGLDRLDLALGWPRLHEVLRWRAEGRLGIRDVRQRCVAHVHLDGRLGNLVTLLGFLITEAGEVARRHRHGRLVVVHAKVPIRRFALGAGLTCEFAVRTVFVRAHCLKHGAIGLVVFFKFKSDGFYS